MKKLAVIALAILIGSTMATLPAMASNAPTHITLRAKDDKQKFKVPVGSAISFELKGFRQGWVCVNPQVTGTAVKSETGSTNSIPPHIWTVFESVAPGTSTITFSCYPPSKPGEMQRHMTANYTVEIEVVK